MTPAGTRYSHGRAVHALTAIAAALLVVACTPKNAAPPGPATASNDPQLTPQTGERRVLYYRNPMNASVTSPVPAKDAMGMDYVAVYADERAGQGSAEVHLSDAVIRKLGVRSVPVAMGPLPGQVRVSGIVQFNEHSVREIRLRADGWIEELSVRAVGDAVRRGQPLLKLYSPRLESAEQEFLNSLGFDDAARTAVAERRLTDLGIEPAFIAELRETRKVPHLIPFHAPADGVVTELSARQGSYVEPVNAIMRLASLSPAWVIAEVPESGVASVAVGGMAKITANAYPGRQFDGRVDYVYAELDSTTRALRVRLLVDNDEQLLKPNMYVSAQLEGAQSEPVLHVPRDAVIRDGNASRVILALPDGRFAPRIVQTGREAGNDVVVLSGLATGDRVVTSAVFLIDSEASLEASLARLGTAAEDAPVAPDAGSMKR